ncbi:hypothetical protein [Nocardia huaxiensis]|uniref:hypothetical protein n=1 Tax=Nocardia huaxiensis TaxID=2755382 RepID=UPI001E6161E6|nr:hypothetical protein [Nocardia huaxiensis]UFS93747.1 hypothetical protein LPY97_23455 [Nocardia huaxiensis]
MSTFKTGIRLVGGDEWQPSRQEIKFLRDRGLIAQKRNRQRVDHSTLDENAITMRALDIVRNARIDDGSEIAEVGITAAQIVQRDLGVTADDVSEECIGWLEKVVTKLLSPGMSGAVQKALAPESVSDARLMLVAKYVRRNRRDNDGNLILDFDNTRVLAYAVTASAEVVESITLTSLREQKVKSATRDASRAAAMTARMPTLAPYVIADAKYNAEIAARNTEKITVQVLAGLDEGQRRNILTQAETLASRRQSIESVADEPNF